jgi:hypothetical protein
MQGNVQPENAACFARAIFVEQQHEFTPCNRNDADWRGW